jgi:hypothetical protein
MLKKQNPYTVHGAEVSLLWVFPNPSYIGYRAHPSFLKPDSIKKRGMLALPSFWAPLQ